jgi:hypothetical protein
MNVCCYQKMSVYVSVSANWHVQRVPDFLWVLLLSDNCNRDVTARRIASKQKTAYVAVAVAVCCLDPDLSSDSLLFLVARFRAHHSVTCVTRD